jgi:hypothetical protein
MKDLESILRAGCLVLIVCMGAGAVQADDGDFVAGRRDKYPPLMPMPKEATLANYYAAQVHFYSSDPAGFPTGDPCATVFLNDTFPDPEDNGVFHFCVTMDQRTGLATDRVYSPTGAQQGHVPAAAFAIKYGPAAKTVPESVLSEMLQKLTLAGTTITLDQRPSRLAVLQPEVIGAAVPGSADTILMHGWRERLASAAAAIAKGVKRIFTKTPKDPEPLPFKPSPPAGFPSVMTRTHGGMTFGQWLMELGAKSCHATITKGKVTATGEYYTGIPAGTVIDFMADNLTDGQAKVRYNGLFELVEATCGGYKWQL